MRSFDTLRISRNLPAILVLLMVAVVSVFALFAVRTQERALIAAVSRGIAGTLLTSGERTEAYFQATAFDLRRAARETETVQALRGLSLGWRGLGPQAGQVLRDLYVRSNPHPPGERHRLMAADDSSYSRVHAGIHADFLTRLQDFGYYDIFLFDLSGNLLYSVQKEPDFATNLLTGRWRGSGLGRAVRAALALPEGGQVFEDFASFAPSDNAPAAFLAQPVFDSVRRIGVIAYQLPDPHFADAPSTRDLLGATGAAILVGDDMKLRSGTAGAGQPMATDSASVRAALAGGVGTVLTRNPAGVPVVQTFRPVQVLGRTWAAVINVAQAEALEEARLLRRLLTGGSLAVIAAASLAALLLLRSIARPLDRVSQAVAALARGELEVTVPNMARHDEVGLIARRVEDLRRRLRDAGREDPAHAFNAAAFANSSSAILMTDGEGEVLQVNAALLALLRRHAAALAAVTPGFDPEAVVGGSMHDVLPPSAVQRVRKQLAGAEKLPITFDLTLGTLRLTFHVDRVRDGSGGGIGYVAEVRDPGVVAPAVDTPRSAADRKGARRKEPLAAYVPAPRAWGIRG